MTTAVSKTKDQTLRQLLSRDDIKQQLAMALPKHITADRMVRTAMTAMLRAPKLQECDQTSFMQSMLALSAAGLEPDGRNAHLIPFKNNKLGIVECQLVIDYKGLVALAMRSGKVSTIHADIVCENDVFEYNMGVITAHKIDYQHPRGNAYAVYAIVRMKDGTAKCEVMSCGEVEDVRKRSKAANSGPWVTDWSEMAKKTAFRRLSKWLELSPEYRDALDRDFDRRDDMDVIDVQVNRQKTKALSHILSGSEPEQPANANEPQDEGPPPLSYDELIDWLAQTRSEKEMPKFMAEVARATLTDEEHQNIVDAANMHRGTFA